MINEFAEMMLKYGSLLAIKSIVSVHFMFQFYNLLVVQCILFLLLKFLLPINIISLVVYFNPVNFDILLNEYFLLLKHYLNVVRIEKKA